MGVAIAGALISQWPDRGTWIARVQDSFFSILLRVRGYLPVRIAPSGNSNKTAALRYLIQHAILIEITGMDRIALLRLIVSRVVGLLLLRGGTLHIAEQSNDRFRGMTL